MKYIDKLNYAIANGSVFVDEEKLSYAISLLLKKVQELPEQSGKNVRFHDGFFGRTEGYKYRVFESARAELDFQSWSIDMIGSGTISNNVIKAIRKSQNLVYFTTKSFENKIEMDIRRSDQIFYDIYCSEDDKYAFDQCTEYFGFRYDRTAYLFFLKDRNRYLPIKPRIFDDIFQRIGIESDCANGLSWNHYMEYLDIIREVMQRIEPLFDHSISLLDAHSFVWCMYLIKEDLMECQFKYADYSNGLIQIDVQSWCCILKQEQVFSSEELMILKRMYLAPNHAVTCKRLAKEMSIHASLLISLITGMAKNVVKYMNLETSEWDAEDKKWWSVLLLGRELPNGIFEWKLRSELVEAISSVLNDDLEYLAYENEAQHASDEELFLRLDAKDSKPVIKKVTTVANYNRDPRIAEFAKRMAKGVCQLCGYEAPFEDKKGNPYLESHHIIPLSELGSDTMENIIALCPNCHRKMHVLGDSEDIALLKDCAIEFVDRQKKLWKNQMGNYDI